MIQSVIELLDDNSINKIAAGEVIDRPSSVVKELVENSLDAGARRIEVDIEAGGIGKIKVSDDGCGMSEADVRMAVLRHATSKIRSADDLLSVSSLGFRGEALPSIASVSRFHLISRQPGMELGTRLEISGGQLSDVRECGAEVGTVVVVSDLFFNTPARLKFMKSAAAESAHIHEALVRLAISRPDVTFRLTNNDRTTLHTPGTGRLSDTLSALYGAETLQQLFPVDHCEGDIRISGFAARPSVRKGSRQWQSFTVNRRVIVSRMLNRAVDTAYQTLLPSGSYPLVALTIELPLQLIDVNVHPQKSEVKFQDDRIVFRTLHSALKSVLFTPENPASAAASFDHASYRPQVQNTYIQGELQIREYLRNTTPDVSGSISSAYSGCRSRETGFDDPSDDIPYDSSRNAATTVPAAFGDPASSYEAHGRNDVHLESRLKVLGQHARCYILASDGNDLFIVDQHAAHERLLFDLLAQKQAPSAYQTLLIPIVMDLDHMESHTAEIYATELAGLGFLFDWVGPGSIRISELPTHLPPQEAENLFRQFLSSAMNLKTPDAEEFLQLWIETAACHMAVRAGQALNEPQMQGLLDDLMKSERPYTCPHGRPTVIRLAEKDLAKLFKRI